MAQPIISNIDEVNRQVEEAHEPGDLFLIPLPMPVYKGLSDAAAKKNMTVAQLLARAITIAITEE
jgi:hypothetical protein